MQPMIKRISILSVLLCWCLVLHAQEPTLFENDALGIAFASDCTWQSVENSSGETLELVNRNHNLELKMYYEQTDLPAGTFLNEVLEREGLNGIVAPFTTLIDQHDATGVIAGCTEMRRPVKVLLIAVRNSDGFYVMRFKCPDECFREHKHQMQELLGSIIIRNNRESYIFYAEQSRSS